MRIEKIKVEGFGKLSQREWELSPGINIFYGQNEGGKSTLHAFLRGMFYGMPRMRGRAARNDGYRRYEPWENPGVYGGKLWMNCGGKIFRLSRTFQKERTGAQLICETDGERLSVENGDLQILLGEVSEAVYDNTVSVGQLKSVTDKSLAMELRDYMAGYQEGMDAGLNLEKAKARLRSQKKDILAVMEERSKRQAERLCQLEEKIQDRSRVVEQLGEEYRQSLRTTVESERECEDGKREEPVREGTVGKGWLLGNALLVLAILLGFIFLRGILPWIVLFGLGGCGVFLWRFAKKRTSQGYGEDRKDWEASRLQCEKVKWQTERLEERLQEEKSLLENQRMEYSQMREEEAETQTGREDVEALDLAEQTIQRLAVQMQGRISHGLKERVSQIFCQLTEGKYRRVELDENMNLGVHTEEEYIQADRLSRGTIEQLYFALRVAASEVLCREEPLPLILDEVFAMYDDRRLERTLIWLAQCERQVLVFTCQHREAEILDRLGVAYGRVRF